MNIIDQKKVAFIGAGSMAEGMIAGIVRSGQMPLDQIYATNRQNQLRLDELTKRYGIQTGAMDSFPFEEMDMLILAMKPKDAEAALESLKPRIQPDQLIMSVLAGVKLSYIEDMLHEGQPVMRVMPNTSSTIGASATALSAGRYVKNDHMSISQALLSEMGEVYTIQEEQMDIFTGIAGSGPAYFYFLMERIEEAGEEAGLSKELSRQIGAQTLLGAAKMLQETEENPSVLREKITSPNGTTAAGLNALDDFGGGEAIKQAVKHAANRSKEISNQQKQKVSI
ncbi:MULTISPECIES: pyrroline-5-carboxylate reductase [Bacillus]|uniref:pyrroline-5-carboxylate reductase n=2 Tax=Bacillaceae TaxID=186817 RepID=UPI0009B7C666|nr:pyrroline-5-carboxylate reductase [Bacillus safensis]MED0865728.1 pyrroline-5-carboxylate reductase [Bacillus safensis]